MSLELGPKTHTVPAGRWAVGVYSRQPSRVLGHDKQSSF